MAAQIAVLGQGATGVNSNTACPAITETSPEWVSAYDFGDKVRDSGYGG